MGYLGVVNSQDKLRFNVAGLGSAQNWTLVIQLTPANIITYDNPISGISNISPFIFPSFSPDMPLDSAIYHPTRNSIFAVRAGYVSEYGLDLTLLNRSKFTNPCFSKSCIAYDTGNDKLWVGTQGDWAGGFRGDTGNAGVGGGGGRDPSGTAALYKINPSNLNLEEYFDFNLFIFSGNGAETTNQQMEMFGPAVGFYDLMYQDFSGGRLFASLGTYKFPTPNYGMIVSLNPLNPTGNTGYYFEWADVPVTQCAFDSISSPQKLWGVTNLDTWEAYWPFAVNADFTAHYNSFDSALGAGAHGAICLSTVGSGYMYIPAMHNTGLYKYNLDGTINSQPTFPSGLSLGGMTIRMRFNPYDNYIYIPCPATNTVIQYNPSTDTVVQQFSGLDAPHDVVFTPSGVYAVQYGVSGLVQLFNSGAGGVSTPSNISAYWTFEETIPENFRDKVNNFLITRTGTFTSPGAGGGSAINGTGIIGSSYMVPTGNEGWVSHTTTDGPDFNPTTSSGISSWFWLLTSGFNADGVELDINLDAGGFYAGNSIDWDIKNNPNLPFDIGYQVGMYGENSNDNLFISGSGAIIPTAQWTFYGFVWDSINQSGRIYINNSLVSSGSVPGMIVDSGHLKMTFQCSLVSSGLFEIDELGISTNSALTTSQMLSLYNGGTGRTWPAVRSIV